MGKILVSWVGRTDLRAVEESGEIGLGRLSNHWLTNCATTVTKTLLAATLATAPQVRWRYVG